MAQNTMVDATAASEAVAADAANTGPCSSATMKRIGPADTGNPASQPAMPGPQRRPARVMRIRKLGTSSSLRASMTGLVSPEC
jgi:hypothetical protein